MANAKNPAPKKAKREFVVDAVYPVGKIELSSGTRLRARFNETDGSARLDLRVWYKTAKMEEFAATAKGFSVEVDQLESLKAMIEKAIRVAKKNKLKTTKSE